MKYKNKIINIKNKLKIKNKIKKKIHIFLNSAKIF